MGGSIEVQAGQMPGMVEVEMLLTEHGVGQALIFLRFDSNKACSFAECCGISEGTALSGSQRYFGAEVPKVKPL